jgi:hypothetical protein
LNSTSTDDDKKVPLLKEWSLILDWMLASASIADSSPGNRTLSVFAKAVVVVPLAELLTEAS